MSAALDLEDAQIPAAIEELRRLFGTADVATTIGVTPLSVRNWGRGLRLPAAESRSRTAIWYLALLTLRENHKDDGLTAWFRTAADDVRLDWERALSPLTLLSMYEPEFIGPVILAGARRARDRYPRLGRSPLHVAERYAAGELTREQLLEQLVNWRYAPPGPIRDWDEIPQSEPSRFEEVTAAHQANLIDDDLLNQIHASRRSDT